MAKVDHTKKCLTLYPLESPNVFYTKGIHATPEEYNDYDGQIVSADCNRGLRTIDNIHKGEIDPSISGIKSVLTQSGCQILKKDGGIGYELVQDRYRSPAILLPYLAKEYDPSTKFTVNCIIRIKSQETQEEELIITNILPDFASVPTDVFTAAVPSHSATAGPSSGGGSAGPADTRLQEEISGILQIHESLTTARILVLDKVKIYSINTRPDIDILHLYNYRWVKLKVEISDDTFINNISILEASSPPQEIEKATLAAYGTDYLIQETTKSPPLAAILPTLLKPKTIKAQTKYNIKYTEHEGKKIITQINRLPPPNVFETITITGFLDNYTPDLSQLKISGINGKSTMTITVPPKERELVRKAFKECNKTMPAIPITASVVINECARIRTLLNLSYQKRS